MSNCNKYLIIKSAFFRFNAPTYAPFRLSLGGFFLLTFLLCLHIIIMWCEIIIVSIKKSLRFRPQSQFPRRFLYTEARRYLMSNFNKHIDQPFGWEPNEIIFNPNLSFKAKGLWLYMNAKPDGWHFASERIAKETSDGITSIRAALKELASVGLLKWKKQGDGRIIYTLESHCFPQSFPQVDKPELENLTLGDDPELENPTVGKPHCGKTSLINNKEENKERIIKKIDEASALAKKEPSRASDNKFLGRNAILAQEYAF